MNERDFDFSIDPDKDFQEAFQQIIEAIEHPALAELSTLDGPITIADIPAQIRVSEEFKEVIAKYGWPNKGQDGAIEPPRQFASNEEFLRALKPFDDTLKSDDTHDVEPGLRAVAGSYLFRILAVLPIETREDMTSIDGMYGLLPIKHRAEVVYPELFENLTIILPKLRDRYPSTLHTSEDDILYQTDNLAEYFSGEGAPVLTAMRYAHQIMGRLVKADDHDQFMRATGRTPKLQPVRTADEVAFDGF